MVSRRGFFKAAIAATAAISLPALAFSKPKEVKELGIIESTRGITPDIGEWEHLQIFSVGKGKRFETLQDFFDSIPSDAASSGRNTHFVAEIYDEQVMPSHYFGPKNSKQTIELRPAPGKGFLDTPEGKAWKKDDLAAAINAMAESARTTNYYMPYIGAGMP